MGKISLLSKEQKTILACIAEDKYFTDNFYFTGGSALAEFYLKHRISEDFDFLPRMVKPLSLDELKSFFRKLAKKVGMKAVES